MSKYFFLFVIVYCSIAIGPVTAQTKKAANDSSVVIIFSENSAPKKVSGSSEKNIVKIQPLGFINGSFPILLERRINDFFAIEIGAGVTNRNYVRGLFSLARMEGEGDSFKEYPWGSSDNGYDEAELLYNFEFRKPSMGFMYRIEPRIYFSSDAPEGGFLALQYNFARYNFTIPGFVLDANGNWKHKGEAKKEFENITDYMVYYGTQWLNERISIESSLGIGIRKVKGEKYAAKTNGSVLNDGMALYEKHTVNFGIGFKVGYHF